MRRLPHALAALAVTVLAGAGASIPLAAGPADAAETKCPPFVFAEAAKAPAIFHAQITGAGKKDATGAIVYPAKVLTVVHGTAFGQIQVALNAGPCQQKSPLTPNGDYYFFATPKGTTFQLAGQQPRVQAYTDGLQQQITQTFPPPAAPAPPPKVKFGHELLSPVAPFGVLVAPGVALVLIGVLGLFAIRFLGRRTA